jgi:hypothetical protein
MTIENSWHADGSPEDFVLYINDNLVNIRKTVPNFAESAG